MKKIGVVALQGAFTDHLSTLHQLGAEAVPVRLPQEIEGLSGLIIPGGESTTIKKLMADYQLLTPIKKLHKKGTPIFGTCAGMIILAKHNYKCRNEIHPLGFMDIEIRRNAFGRQVDSFEEDLPISVLGDQPFHAIFIRAPWIENIGPGVETLAKLKDGTPVAAQQENLLVSAFHPELTNDPRFHAYFLSMVSK